MFDENFREGMFWGVVIGVIIVFTLEYLAHGYII